MIFPQLADEAAVMFREDCAELFIADFDLTHPESFLHNLLMSRRVIGMTSVTTHHK